MTPPFSSEPLLGSRRLSEANLKTVVALGALSGIILAFYHRLWLPDLVLIKRDAFRFFPPIKQYVVERLAAGDLPQWFPYEGLGRPFLGTPVTGVFHPFTLLYFWMPAHEAYRVSTLLTCLLAGLGAFALGRALQFSRAGAVLSGVGFACSGYVVSLTENLVYLYSIAILPLFCLTLDKAFVNSFAWVVAPAMVWATVFLNGDVHTGYYYGFIALLWTKVRARGAWRRAGGRLAVTGLLALLLACIQLGPALAVFVGSDRSQPASFHEEAVYWSTHPLRLLTIVASPVGGTAHPVTVSHLFFGTRADGQRGDVWAESLYLGVPLVGLALAGAWARRDLRVLGLLGGLTLVLALGRYGGLYEVFYQVVPLWSAFRYPEKLMGIVSFVVAMLPGAGMDALRAGVGREMPWLVVALLCGGLGLGLHTEAASVWTAAHFGAPETVAREVATSTGTALLFSALATLGVATVIAGVRRQWLRWELSLALLVGIVTLDLSRGNLEACHTGPVEAATFTPGLVEAVKRHAEESGQGKFRFLTIHQRRIFYPESVEQSLDLLGASSLMVRQVLDVEHNAQFHLESLKSYLPGYSPALETLMQTVLHESGVPVAARYNAAYYIGRSLYFQSPQFAKALVAMIPDYDLVLVHNPMPIKPRAYLSGHPERAPSPVHVGALFARPDFLSGEVDVIETSEVALPGPARDGRVAIERYEPEEVQIRVQSQEPAVLILLDTFDAGWRATLENGSEVPILRANGLVRAVGVPAGSHVVTFLYHTPLLWLGAVASSGGVVICVAFMTQAWWTRLRRSGSVASDGKTF